LALTLQDMALSAAVSPFVAPDSAQASMTIAEIFREDDLIATLAMRPRLSL
jgi:hypothetical protein